MKYLFSLLFTFPLFGIFVSNPSDTHLFQDGFFLGKCDWLTFRLGYVNEYVLKSRCKYEFQREGEPTEKLDAEMLNYYGVATFNILSRLDLKVIGGSVRMEIDEQIFPKREPAWGVGAALLLFKSCLFDFTIDGKYLCSYQKPTYFVIEDMLAPLVDTKLQLDYEEWQVSLAMSYKTDCIIPYIGVTYFDCRLKPNCYDLLVTLPNIPFLFDVTYKSFNSRKNWGLVLGASIYACDRASLTIEARNFDQTSVNGILQVRF